MEIGRRPLVSVGVPVYNGESGLAYCLDCLLQQDYPNLEIIVSDNGSTDRTKAIAEEYARQHPTVKYCRSDRNRGTFWNFNRVFELSSGEYFFWAAHDDERARTFISECVRALEARPDAVLCQVQTEVTLAGFDKPLYVSRLDSFADTASTVTRYRETLRHFPATAMYGMYRSAAMRRTRMLQPVIATDLAFIQELSIHGPFIQVPLTLFRYRARPNWNTIDEDARVFLGIAHKPWWYRPRLMLLLNHASRLQRAPVPLRLKGRMLMTLASHEVRQLGVKVLIKAAGVLCPEARKETAARALYRRWMQNPNLEVIDEDLFLQRVCKPQLGWWR